MEEIMKYMLSEMEKNAAFRSEVIKMTNRQANTIRVLKLVACVAVGYAIYTRNRVKTKEV